MAIDRTSDLKTADVVNQERAVPAACIPWYTDLKRHWAFYLMALPGVVSILVFGYGPLFGLTIAFLDYSPVRGITGSDWVGLQNFRLAFQNPFFLIALKNSIIISLLKLAIDFPAAIILALLLNEVRVTWFKRTVQTATMLPYFVSWVIVAAMFRALLAPDGLLNEVRQHIFGLEPVLYLSDPTKFRWIIVFQDMWKGAGYGAVLYLAAMATIPTATAQLPDRWLGWCSVRMLYPQNGSRLLTTPCVLVWSALARLVLPRWPAAPMS